MGSCYNETAIYAIFLAEPAWIVWVIAAVLRLLAHPEIPVVIVVVICWMINVACCIQVLNVELFSLPIVQAVIGGCVVVAPMTLSVELLL
jgi:hypothetical protein